MALILNIESATEICSICISRDEQILALKEASGPNEHAKIITLLIDECLKISGLTLKDMDAVAVSAGPGSYTSLRVGASTAKGICYALDKPLISVDTLQSLALASFQKEEGKILYCPMIDARRMEVYCTLFNAENKVVSPARAIVIEADSFSEYFETETRIVFSGNGAPKCEKILASPLASFLPVNCSAEHLPALSSRAFLDGQFADPAWFTPRYLKAPNVTVSKKKIFYNT